MTTETILSLIAFAFVSSITPGPNNLMLMASGTNFGFKRTIPHMLGISLGVSFMILIVGLGVAGLLKQWPTSYTVLKVLSIIYMLWLAWKIANASAPDAKQVNAKPFSFLQAAAFQWVNPKAWSMALTAVTIYSPQSELHNLLIITLVFALVNLPSVSSWALLGQKIRHWLTDRTHLRIFNWSMAIALIGSLALML